MRKWAMLGLLWVTGCSPTFAPPVRGFMYGAPARLEQGRVELGGTIGGLTEPINGGPHLAIGLRDWVALEVGGNLMLAVPDQDKWAMGFVGTRFSYAPRREAWAHFIGDLELGLGAGIGGELGGNAAPGKDCTYCDGLKATDRTAYGGYEGFGVGARIGWFSIFGRLRFDESAATNVPATLWTSASLGLEAMIRRRVALGVGGGYTGFTNSRDTENGWFYQASVTVFLDAFTPRPAAPAPEATPPRPPPAPPVQEWDEPRPGEEEIGDDDDE
jgi:hypothetical protein